MGWPEIIPVDQRPVIAKQAVSRYVDGERIEDIAPGYGLSAKRLYAYLAEHCEEEWKSAQLGTALEELEAARAALRDSGAEMQDIARARERARLAQWDLERVCRRIYGTDSVPNQGQGTLTINISVGSSSTEPKLVNPTDQD